jgi:hypothetical protein
VSLRKSSFRACFTGSFTSRRRLNTHLSIVRTQTCSHSRSSYKQKTAPKSVATVNTNSQQLEDELIRLKRSHAQLERTCAELRDVTEKQKAQLRDQATVTDQLHARCKDEAFSRTAAEKDLVAAKQRLADALSDRSNADGELARENARLAEELRLAGDGAPKQKKLEREIEALKMEAELLKQRMTDAVMSQRDAERRLAEAVEDAANWRQIAQEKEAQASQDIDNVCAELKNARDELKVFFVCPWAFV